MALEEKRRESGAQAVFSSWPAWFPRNMSPRCLWPTSHKTCCGEQPQKGLLCLKHLRRVRSRAGTRDCAWPGCERRSWDKTGLCSFHTKIAFGLIDPNRG